MKKIVRITTVPLSLEKLLENQLRFMNGHYEVIAVSSEGARLRKFGAKEGVRTFEVGLTRKITPLQDLKAVWQLYRFLKKEKPFMVHSHTPKAGIVGMLAAKLAGVPNRLHTVAGLPLLETAGIKRTILTAVEKLTYSCATKVYPNSKGLRQIILQEKFCSESKLKVIGEGSSNGIDTEYFSRKSLSQSDAEQLKSQLSITQEDFVFVFVGRIVGDKGINELIAAFDKISAESKKVKLLLVGPYEDDLDPLSETTVKRINENKNCISVGYQQDVRLFLAISHCLVFPSYREGFPNVVMQAGAMELPGIVTDINGCNEIITHEKNGLIVPVKSSEALYLAMQRILSEKDLYLRLQQHAREAITSRFEQKVIWEALLAEYQKLEHVS
ncbi:glycosyltransferase family 4 protein [Flavobacterium suncheonense]|uniref:Glycosyl transferase family 1 n=1 Tax=Flavobacterium suncheonense GH29-5 = DSM 17707 TaxID=1121899 RepID=A0A0A2MM70_9FLAO|nr:glycosyltransferase family 4 protein [Flavobacterium suncheonense]KGO89385.1 glycosyl transferase family 1 [Flavobacterium suncheonense GH29-5 = DSM 17707]